MATGATVGAGLLGRIRQDRRLVRLAHGGLSALLGRGVGLLVNAISLPLTVRYLGVERYGIWITVSSSVAMLAVMDLGVASSLTNSISRAFAGDDRVAARRAYSNAFWFSTALSCTLGLLVLLVWPRVPWASLFHTADPGLLRECIQCVAIALGFFLLGLPLNLIHRVLSGYQKTQITNYVALCSSLLGLLSILVVILLHGSLTTLMLLYSVSLLSGTVCINLVSQIWTMRWMRPSLAMLSQPALRECLSGGVGFFLLQLAGLIVFNSDNLVITHYLGAAEVAPYSVAWRLAGYATVLQMAVLPSLWPAFAEGFARGDLVWVRRTFFHALRIVLAVVGCAVVLTAVMGRGFIRWYVGPNAVPSEALLIAICFWTLLSAVMDLEACLLAALSRVKAQGVLSIVAAIVNLTLSIVLVKRIGSLGVVLGTIGSYLLVLTGPQTVIVWRTLYPTVSAHSSRAPGRRGVLLRFYKKRGRYLVHASLTLLFRAAVQLAVLLHVLPRARAANPPRRLLVVHLTSHLGDTIMLLPLLEELRRTHPDARLEVAVEPGAAALLRMLVGVDHVHALPLGRFQATDLARAVRRALEIVRLYWLTMRSALPDTCLVVRWGDDPFRSSTLAYLTQAPRRIAFDSSVLSPAVPRESYRDALFTDLVHGGHGLLESERFLLLAMRTGLVPHRDTLSVVSLPRTSLREIAAQSSWPEVAARLGLQTGDRFAVIAPGASHPRRVWPLENWAIVCRWLRARGLAVVLLSGPQDAELSRELYALAMRQTGSAVGVRLAAGVTTLPESITLLSQAQVFLGSDSGPGHIAGGLGVPSVILFTTVAKTVEDGTASPERMRPAGPHVAVCALSHTLPPCENNCSDAKAHCITVTRPEAVIAAVESLEVSSC